jgi:hypothetical protein
VDYVNGQMVGYSNYTGPSAFYFDFSNPYLSLSIGSVELTAPIPPGPLGEVDPFGPTGGSGQIGPVDGGENIASFSISYESIGTDGLINLGPNGSASATIYLVGDGLYEVGTGETAYASFQSVPDPASVPEPSSIAMAVTAVLMIIMRCNPKFWRCSSFC